MAPRIARLFCRLIVPSGLRPSCEHPNCLMAGRESRFSRKARFSCNGGFFGAEFSTAARNDAVCCQCLPEFCRDFGAGFPATDDELRVSRGLETGALLAPCAVERQSSSSSSSVVAGANVFSIASLASAYSSSNLSALKKRFTKSSSPGKICKVPDCPIRIGTQQNATNNNTTTDNLIEIIQSN